ncbi:MAG: TauD/TfdA family dioxygenase [Sphingobium sp.]
MTIRFENVKPLIGSVVHFDNRDEIFTEEAMAQFREAIDNRTVIVFPKVNFTDEEQLRFTDMLGARVNLTSNSVTDKPTEVDVYQVTLDRRINSAPEYVLGTFFWHMDGLTVDMPPPKATLLSCRRASADGGQTEFSSTFAAYEHLPEDDKTLIENLKATHSVRASLRPIADIIPPEDEAKLEIGIIKDHPIVWRRPDGRASLVIGTTTDRVAGMEIVHGRALLTRLLEWAVQPDFTYRHQWSEGDFVVWDNCGAMHRVIPYDWESGRMMHRTSIAGQEAVGA